MGTAVQPPDCPPAVLNCMLPAERTWSENRCASFFDTRSYPHPVSMIQLGERSSASIESRCTAMAGAPCSALIESLIRGKAPSMDPVMLRTYLTCDGIAALRGSVSLASSSLSVSIRGPTVIPSCLMFWSDSWSLLSTPVTPAWSTSNGLSAFFASLGRAVAVSGEPGQSLVDEQRLSVDTWAASSICRRP